MTEATQSVLSGLKKCSLSASEYPHETALVLLSHVLGKPKTWVIAHPESYLSIEQSKALNLLCERLQQGEPLAYLTGRQAFFGLDFKVTSDVLIPRPETELLVETALTWLANHPKANQGLDVGTGSGCIPISLLIHAAELQMTAIDLSAAALGVAAKNAETHQITERLHLIQSDMLDQIQSSFDLITANLPYIPTDKLRQVNSLPFEPKLALDGGEDGLVLIRRLLNQAPKHLNRPGLILLEIESTLGEVTLALAQATFPTAEVGLHQDLAGLDRLVYIQVI
ncbi:MAG: peptide chain release factor N(5)-glutamine methyltransferase [Anaerolineaceae bacterium]